MTYTSDDDTALAQTGKVSRASRSRNIISYKESDDDDDDLPLSQQTTKNGSRRKVKSEDDEEEEDIPIATTRKRTKKLPSDKGVKKVKNEVKSEDGLSKIATISKPKKTSTTAKKATSKKLPAKKENGTKNLKKENDTRRANAKNVKKEDSQSEEAVAAEEEEEMYKWWEQEDLNNEIKWNTLEHNGVIFPPDYEPLPANVKLVYDGQLVTLPSEAEEVAGFFGAMLNTDHAQNPTFQKNFFNDFVKILSENGGTKEGTTITDFKKCDFTKMFDYFEEKRAAKKLLTAAQKKEIKRFKDEEESSFKFCTMDGRKEQVGNFRVEPPGLFRGRGSHPKTGTLKKRVRPEDITINIGKEAKIPEPPAGHKWAEVKHDNTGAWLAMWKENVLGGFKYVRLAANSSIKGISDYKKFEKARNLKNYIDVIRRDYRGKLRSSLMQDRQMATATYLIDVFALRAGGEKGEDEADTVGCCSLRYEHISLKPPNTVIFDFLGKDSIRFYQEVEVDRQVFKNLKIFKKPPKDIGDQLFDRIDPPILNKHFQNYMVGLTAKVFRTYNASKTMAELLKKIPNEGTVNEKIVKFNAANREVAILCNHQRSVTKGHAASVNKINEKINEMRWLKTRAKITMLQIDKKLRKKKGDDYFSEIGLLSAEEVEVIANAYHDKEIERLTKKFQRDNEKLEMNKEPMKPKSALKEELKKVENKKKMWIREGKTGKIKLEDYEKEDVEKLEQIVEKIEARITNTCLQLKDKEDNATVALGTSKINYIDPRLTVVFSKRFNVPIEKLFTKTLREKFKWAIESADENWEF